MNRVKNKRVRTSKKRKFRKTLYQAYHNNRLELRMRKYPESSFHHQWKRMLAIRDIMYTFVSWMQYSHAWARGLINEGWEGEETLGESYDRAGISDRILSISESIKENLKDQMVLDIEE